MVRQHQPGRVDHDGGFEREPGGFGDATRRGIAKAEARAGECTFSRNVWAASCGGADSGAR
eukprot:3334267-Prymnesium_polylepis.1